MTPARIEAAARAMHLASDRGDVAWEDEAVVCRTAFRVQAEAALAAAYPEIANGTAWLAPMEDSEVMWGGLARQIVMWRDMGRRTGAALYEHLSHGEHEIPGWLPALIENAEHFPPKGAVVGAIYRAMRDAHLKAQG